MRTLQRNTQTIWYRLYQESTPISQTDEWGNTYESGEQFLSYGDPVSMKANVSPASGASVAEQFGNLDNYDHVIVTTWMNCPIDENSILYIGKNPVKTDGVWSPHNYVVRRVSKSLNGISIAVRKVDVS